MKSVDLSPKSRNTLLPWAIGLASILFWAPLDDAMVLPKFAVILILVIPIAIYELALSRQSNFMGSFAKLSSVLLGLWAASMLVSAAFGNNLTASLLGQHARQTGVLLYLALSLVFLVILKSNSENTVEQYLNTFGIVALCNLAYCALQFIHLDPIAWNLEFNRIVGFLGNPDFSAAFLGFSVIYLAYYSWFVASKIRFKILVALFAALAFFLILQTQARQGIILSILGIVILLSFVAIKGKLKVGYLGLMALSIGLVVSAFGMVNKGPIASMLYKASIEFRGDYWRASFSMIKDNPLFGVGFGRYGDYFREYRDQTQVLRRGAGLISDQAHNIFLDMFATGGVFVFLAFTTGIACISYLSLIGIRLSKTRKEISQSIVLLALWTAYLAQSFISIDQVALALWGWIFGALICKNYLNLRTSIELETPPKILKKSFQYVAILVSAVSLIASIAIIAPIWSASQNIRLANGLQGNVGASLQGQSQIIEYATKTIEKRPLDNYFYQQAGILLVINNQIDRGINSLEKSISLNPRDAVSLAVLGSIYRQTSKYELGIEYFSKAIQLDPLNQMNYFERMSCYLATNQRALATKDFNELIAIDSKSTIAIDARNIYS